MTALPAWATLDHGVLRLRVKAVPGASRDAIVGALGDRLKVRVAAAPEGGKANAAIEGLIASALGISERSVRVEQGHASPLKVLRVEGVAPERLAELDAADR